MSRVVAFRIDDDTFDELTEAAERQGVSRSALLTELVNSYLVLGARIASYAPPVDVNTPNDKEPHYEPIDD